MNQDTLRSLVGTAVVLTVVVPLASACTSLPNRSFRVMKMLPAHHPQRFIRTFDHKPDRGPENLVNPRAKASPLRPIQNSSQQ